MKHNYTPEQVERIKENAVDIFIILKALMATFQLTAKFKDCSIIFVQAEKIIKKILNNA